jgi:hypothetical protein
VAQQFDLADNDDVNLPGAAMRDQAALSITGKKKRLRSVA